MKSLQPFNDPPNDSVVFCTCTFHYYHTENVDRVDIINKKKPNDFDNYGAKLSAPRKNMITF